MVSHDLGDDSLRVVVDLNEHRFLTFFAPCKKLVVFLLKFVIDFNRRLEPPFLDESVEAFPHEAKVLRTIDSSPCMYERATIYTVDESGHSIISIRRLVRASECASLSIQDNP